MSINIPSHSPDRSDGRIRQDNEQRIISAAQIEFAQFGYKGATISNIANRAQLPKSNIHYYFKSKQHLYIEVLSNIIDLWDEALNELTLSDEPREALARYIDKKMRFSREYPYASRVFAKEILSGAPQLKEYFDEGYQKWFRSRTKVFTQWARQGKIAQLPAAHIVFLLWSSTQHYADFTVQIAAAMGVDELSDRHYRDATKTLTEIITRGIGAE